MKDELLIASACNEQVRIHAVCSTEICEEARRLHDLYPTSCAALGRVLSVTALLGSDLKDKQDKITVTLNGHGPAGTIMAVSDGDGNLKGFIQDPHIYLSNPENGKLDVGRAVGKDGTLRVMKDLGLKEPFTGEVPLVSGEIGDDFSRYFVSSEQTPTVVSVGVLIGKDCSVLAAGALLIQLMPDADEETIAKTETRAKNLKPISGCILNASELSEAVMPLYEDVQILEHKDVRWHCGCSREHFEEALCTLHEKDLKDMADEDHGAEIVCQFCEKKYQFSEEDIRKILRQKETCGK